MNLNMSSTPIYESNATNRTSPATDAGNFVEPAPMRWTLRMIFVLVFLVGMVGNAVVCAAVIRRKRLRTSNNIFTFNLAFCDLLIVVIFVPTQMAAFENNQNWPLGHFACQLAYITIPLCLSASIMTLVTITFDRYRAIAHPMKPRLTMKTVKITLAVIWVASFLIVLPLVFVAGEIRPAPDQVYCDETWPEGPYKNIYWLFIFFIEYILPLGVIMVLAILIALKIRQNSAQMLRSSNVVVAAVRQRTKQTAKITNMLIALVILYAVCMLPQHIVYLWWTYGDLGQSKYKVYVLRFSNVFPMANSAFNPFAYGLNKEWSHVFKSFFKCEFNKPESPQVNGSLHRTGKFRNATYRNFNDGKSRQWRRKSSASSLYCKSDKTSRWKKMKRREGTRNTRDDLAPPREMAVPNGEAGQTRTPFKAKRPVNGSNTPPKTFPPERQALLAVEGTTDEKILRETSIAADGENAARKLSSKSRPEHVVREDHGSSKDETTSLLSEREMTKGRGILERQQKRENRVTLESMFRNPETKTSRDVLYLSVDDASSETADDQLTDWCIESCIKFTLNKPEEEIMDYIKSLEETDI